MPPGGIDDEGIDFIASACTLLQEIFEGLHWNLSSGSFGGYDLFQPSIAIQSGDFTLPTFPEVE